MSAFTMKVIEKFISLANSKIVMKKFWFTLLLAIVSISVFGGIVYLLANYILLHV